MMMIIAKLLRWIWQQIFSEGRGAGSDWRWRSNRRLTGGRGRHDGGRGRGGGGMHFVGLGEGFIRAFCEDSGVF